MTVLVSGATQSVGTAPAWVGRLITPRGRHLAVCVDDGRPWAMDNGCFSVSGFDAEAFLRMLERFAGKPGCLFVTAPDVLIHGAAGVRGDSTQTLEQFPRWARVIRAFRFPVALVLQDGVALDDVPWNDLDAVFIGGSDAFKTSPAVRAITAVARALGKHAHMGRVSGSRRWRYARSIGVQTYDSSGFSRYFDEMRARGDRWQRAGAQLELFGRWEDA